MTITVARVSLLGCLCLSAHFALAAEPDSAPAAMPARGVGLTILSKLPYVGKLFGVDVQCESCDVDCPPVCEAQQFTFRGADGLERIGVDFECELVQHSAPCREKAACPAKNALCPVNCAPTCAPACQPAARPIAFAPAGPPAFPMAPQPPHPHPDMMFPVGMPQPVCISPGFPMEGMFEAMMETRLEAFGAIEEIRKQAREHETELMSELLKARVEAAVAQSKLEARQEAAATEAALRKELAQAHLESIHLAAKLQVATEKEQLAAELREARAELAALKAKSGAEEQTARRVGQSRR